MYQQKQDSGFPGGNGCHGGNCGGRNGNQIHITQIKGINTTGRISTSKTFKGNCVLE